MRVTPHGVATGAKSKTRFAKLRRIGERDLDILQESYNTWGNPWVSLRETTPVEKY